MQRCPKCGRTYQDDTQKFCTNDGGRLEPDATPASSQAPTSYDLNPTINISDQFDPEATVTRMPELPESADLNKTMASFPTPTTDIRRPDTGPVNPPQPPAAPPPGYPPPAPQHPQGTPTQPYQPQQQQPQPYYQPMPPAGAPPQPQGHYQQRPQGAYQQPAPSAAAGARRSRLPLIIGLIVVALLGSAAAWYFLFYKKGEAGTSNANATANANSNANANANANATANTGNANANTTAASTPAPASVPEPPPNTTGFVNSADNLDGKLADHYVDFSFYYPNTWTRDPKAGVPGASNFAKVERMLPPNYTQENFAVGWYTSKGTFEGDRDTFPKVAESLSNSFSKSFPEYRKVSEGPTKVNSLDAYELRFESVSRGTDKGDIKLWGRVIFLPPGVEGQRNGATLLMLATSLAPELKSADDVGVKGELPVILNSFRIGKE